MLSYTFLDDKIKIFKKFACISSIIVLFEASVETFLA